ncbi:MAG: LytTR family transcriptional regulator [Paludibacteraceae bacterium]|nr:LytTR family transcriptional regulator [Paludibacteraceae bacterium]
MWVPISALYSKMIPIRRKCTILLVALLSLSGCGVYEPLSTDVTYTKTLAYEGSPYEQMMDAFASDATNYLKLSREMMAEGDSIAKLVEDTVIESVDADSLLSVSYSNMLEGDKIERYQKSIEYANEALVIAKQTGERSVEKKIYRQLSDVYERLDNKEYADYYKHKSDEITDTIATVVAIVGDGHWHGWWIILVVLLLFIAITIFIIIWRRNHEDGQRDQNLDTNPTDSDEPDDVPVLLKSKTNNNAELKPGRVVYLKSEGNYTTIYFLNDRNRLDSIEIYQSMSTALTTLSTREHFFRCHRSYAVNMRYVTSWNDFNVQLTCTQPVPLSKTYLEKFENANISVHESE